MEDHGGKAEAIHAQLMESLGELTTSEDWERALETASRFHDYSFGNCLLIMRQSPDASRVAGFQTWKSLGRYVRKGEKGIAILAPMTFRRKAETEGEEDTVGVRGFRVVYVFDIAQTDGADVPEIMPHRLEGDGIASLYVKLAGQVEAEGYSLTRGDPGMAGANGVTMRQSRSVIVREDVSDAQATKTLAHELAHVLMHCADAADIPDGNPRSVREIEAESVAYIVCKASGLETEGYSLPYVAQWANGDLKAIQATAKRVVETARRILDAS